MDAASSAIVLPYTNQSKQHGVHLKHCHVLNITQLKNKGQVRKYHGKGSVSVPFSWADDPTNTHPHCAFSSVPCAPTLEILQKNLAHAVGWLGLPPLLKILGRQASLGEEIEKHKLFSGSQSQACQVPPRRRDPVSVGEAPSFSNRKTERPSRERGHDLSRATSWMAPAQATRNKIWRQELRQTWPVPGSTRLHPLPVRTRASSFRLTPRKA